MWGENATVLDGTQLAADWTFSGLQKFGQGLLDRLKGLQLPSPLLEKVRNVKKHFEYNLLDRFCNVYALFTGEYG